MEQENVWRMNLCLSLVSNLWIYVSEETRNFYGVGLLLHALGVCRKDHLWEKCSYLVVLLFKFFKLILLRIEISVDCRIHFKFKKKSIGMIEGDENI
jgi:hypothetical protein